MKDAPKKIEVVNGNVDELKISPVYEHLKVAKPKTKENEKNKKIIIPKTKKK
ncbi:MAG: hypothetical protein HFJ27_04270 [Clostridia bacterium]|nr:hypothetical protein [Clostridia bacterium]